MIIIAIGASTTTGSPSYARRVPVKARRIFYFYTKILFIPHQKFLFSGINGDFKQSRHKIA
jgi:hypothetical protein